MKNQSTGRSKRLHLLAGCCQRRIMLTGTPLQNDLQELHALLRFLVPSIFKDEPSLEDVQVRATPIGFVCRNGGVVVAVWVKESASQSYVLWYLWDKCMCSSCQGCQAF